MSIRCTRATPPATTNTAHRNRTTRRGLDLAARLRHLDYLSELGGILPSLRMWALPRLYLSSSFVLMLFLLGCGNGKTTFLQISSFQLTVALSSVGAGTVTSSPPGINCPTTCSATFPLGTPVTLTATPTASYFFSGWSGNCSGGGTCTLQITSAESVTASFKIGVPLSVTVSGKGTVTSNPPGIDCPTTCSAAFPQGTTVSLSETPATNAAFSSWGGACAGTSSCSVTLVDPNSVTATFASSTVVGGGSTPTVVYVSTGTNIAVYTADSSGQLTPLPGSPVSNIIALATNGKFLFGTDGINIVSFAIASDGTLNQVSSINATQFNGDGQCGGGPMALFLDRTGTTLYDVDGNTCANDAYESFSIDQSTGTLSFLAISTDQSPVFSTPLSFLANNLFGYGSSCYHFIPAIFGFARKSDGTLTLNGSLGSNPAIPAAPSGSYYCPYLAAADAANDVIIPLTPLASNSFQVTGSTQLAVYTADIQGNLTTTSTASNMRSTSVSGTATPLGVNDIRVSPSGSFVAVSGPMGLQVFQLHGANPVTQKTQLLVTNEIDQIRWDTGDHLYAISNPAGQLFVFTVTQNGVSQAPGSPYTVAQPNSLAVWPTN